MDVARTLVEVDLTKPVPNHISFKGRNGSDVLVSISYLWLTPRCNCCKKWGHKDQDCLAPKPMLDKQKLPEVENDKVIL